MIEMGKKYRIGDGASVRILCVDAKSRFSVVGLVNNCASEYIETWTSEGLYGDDPLSPRNLVEVSPPGEWPIDTAIWVGQGSWWWPRHFAGVDQAGRVCAWENGGTSFTSEGKVAWQEARLASVFNPNAEERGA